MRYRHPVHSACSPGFFGLFSAKTRREGQVHRANSVDSSLRPRADGAEIRCFKRKKRYEEWDAKGGFNITRGEGTGRPAAKAITDLSMAQVLGVEPDASITSRLLKKRPATTSPMEPTGDWNLKRNKSETSQGGWIIEHEASMEDTQAMDEDDLDFTGGFGHRCGSKNSGAVDPKQPSQSS